MSFTPFLQTQLIELLFDSRLSFQNLLIRILKQIICPTLKLTDKEALKKFPEDLHFCVMI